MDEPLHLFQPPAQKPRTYETDQLWECLTELFGPARTGRERGRRNTVVKEMRDAAATREEVVTTYEYCRRRFSTFTEVALTGHLSAALQQSGEGGAGEG